MPTVGGSRPHQTRAYSSPSSCTLDDGTVYFAGDEADHPIIQPVTMRAAERCVDSGVVVDAVVVGDTAGTFAGRVTAMTGGTIRHLSTPDLVGERTGVSIRISVWGLPSNGPGTVVAASQTGLI